MWFVDRLLICAVLIVASLLAGGTLISTMKAEHDDDHSKGELAMAAIAYAASACAAVQAAAEQGMRLGDLDYAAMGAGVPEFWPWFSDQWKPKSIRRDLVRAAALLIAEIDRLDRAGRLLDGVEHSAMPGVR